MSPRSSLMLLMVVLLILAGATVRAVSPDGSDTVYLPTVLKSLPPTPVPELCDILEDDFSDPSSGWYVDDNPNYATSYDAGEYRALLRVRGSFGVLARGGYAFESKSAAIDARWEDAVGEGYGFYIISPTPTIARMYRVIVMAVTGQYRVQFYGDTGQTTIVPPTSSPVINPGTATNRVKITLVGTHVTLHINGTAVTTFPIVEGSYQLGLDTSTQAPYGTYPAAARYDNYCLSSVNGTSATGDKELTSAPLMFSVGPDGVVTFYEEASE